MKGIKRKSEGLVRSEPKPTDVDETGSSPGTIWTCPMHPEIRRNEAGPCPICGMDLEPTRLRAGSCPPSSSPRS